MKRLDVSKVLGISALALSLATLPAVLPASAQTTTTPDGTVRTTNTDTNTERSATDGNYQDGDWGLLGLLGLFGLFGRKSRKANESVAYSNRDVVGTSGNRSNY